MRYRLLGNLAVANGAGTAVNIPAAKRRALLAILLLHRGRPIQRGAIIDALWGDSAPNAASESLFAHVSRLRSEIGETAILTVSGGYVLPVRDDELDILAFEQAVAAGRRSFALGHWRAAAKSFGAALELWDGPALAEFGVEAFAQAEIARLDEMRAGALEDRIDAELETGRDHDLVPELERLVQEHPLRERLWGQLMLALYRGGRQSDALDRYRKLRRLLVTQLGLDPGPEIQALQRRILRHDVALAAPVAKDEQAAVELPAYPTQAIGRRREVETARATLAAQRLLTLTGPGGVGKTRLAVLVAEAVLSEYPDGVQFVDLSMVREPDRLLERIGATIGGGGRPDLAIGRRRVLLVLDNFEQVLDAAAAVSTLLRRCPNLRVIVTSRAPLRIAGEWQLEVPPLDSVDAVELFVDRASAALASETLAREVVREVVTRLDGLPLAVELAAARVKGLTVEAIQLFLDDRMSFLSAGSRDAPDRHRTLRDTIRWSYELLAPDVRASFRNLSVLAPGFDLEAAMVIGEARIDDIAELVDQSLLRRVDDRYSMLETIRAFSEEAATEDEGAAARSRHIRHFAALLRAVRFRSAEPPNEVEPPNRDRWLEACARNTENLRLAFERADAAGDADSIITLYRGLGIYWLYIGATEEAVRWAEITLQHAEGRPEDLEHVRILAADFARFSGDLGRALSLLQLVLDGAAARGDLVQVTMALDDMAGTYASMDEYDEAWALIGRAHATHRLEARCEPRHLVHTLGIEIYVLLRQGRVAEAEATSHRYLEAHNATPTWSLRTLEVELVLAYVAAAVERLEDARAAYRRIIASTSPAQYRFILADALDGLAGVERDRPDNAARLLGMADRARAESRAMIFFEQQRQALIRELRDALGPEAYEAARREGEGVPVVDMAIAAVPDLVDQGTANPVLLSRGHREGRGFAVAGPGAKERNVREGSNHQSRPAHQRDDPDPTGPSDR